MMNEEKNEEKNEGNLLIIDGDAIPFILGWVNREHQDIPTMERSVDSWMEDFLLLAAGEEYIGVVAASNPTAAVFREHTYKFKKYKGDRKGEPEPWVEYWRPIIKQMLVDRWGFVRAPSHVETDDVIAYLGHGDNGMREMRSGSWLNTVICSPDKDLKQVPGIHFDYKKATQEKDPVIKQEVVTKQKAFWNWCMQMLMGDSTDGIVGIPGIGEKKAAELLDKAAPAGELFPETMWKIAIKNAYTKAFGTYYGGIIYEETETAVTMMTPTHPQWTSYGYTITPYLEAIRDKNYGKLYRETQR